VTGAAAAFPPPHCSPFVARCPARSRPARTCGGFLHTGPAALLCSWPSVPVQCPAGAGGGPKRRGGGALGGPARRGIGHASSSRPPRTPSPVLACVWAAAGRALAAGGRAHAAGRVWCPRGPRGHTPPCAAETRSPGPPPFGRGGALGTWGPPCRRPLRQGASMASCGGGSNETRPLGGARASSGVSFWSCRCPFATPLVLCHVRTGRVGGGGVASTAAHTLAAADTWTAAGPLPSHRRRHLHSAPKTSTLRSSATTIPRVWSDSVTPVLPPRRHRRPMLGAVVDSRVTSTCRTVPPAGLLPPPPRAR